MFTFLPGEYRSEILRQYRKKLYTLGLLMLVVSALFGAAFALPTFIALSSERSTVLEEKRVIDESFGLKAGIDAEKEIVRVKSALDSLKSISERRTIASELERIVVRKNPGISITRIVISRGEESDQIAIEGTALTRDGLVGFSKDLEGEPSFIKVDLPISSLAKSADIPFSIRIESKK